MLIVVIILYAKTLRSCTTVRTWSLDMYNTLNRYIHYSFPCYLIDQLCQTYNVNTYKIKL